MARITHDGQSFLIENRRIWLLGAGIDYARVPSELWTDRIAAAGQAGFNTVVTSAPWLLHEPRKGRYSFSGDGDLRQFVELCIEAGLYVGLRAGPYIDTGYDGGGLPSWLRALENVALREPNDAYLERVGLYFRKLLSNVSGLEAGDVRAGGLIFVQAEHGWRCTNDEAAETYLGEIARHVRENGIGVPVISANDLWAEARRTIETWSGWDRLLVNLRQLRAIHPDRPRIVSGFACAEPVVWGDEATDTRSARAALDHLAQVLAAGAQAMVAPFHGGTNFGFLAGRRSGRPDGFLTTTAYPAAPLGEAGYRGRKYEHLKRLVTFATHFGAVFADLDPDYHPVTVALESLQGPEGKRTKAGGRGVAVVPLRGAQGRVIFVFGDPDATNQSTALLLDHGIPLSIELGDQSVGWYLIDVDLGGRGRLDYCNLCPFALVDRSILVVFGPERTTGHLSINEGLIEVQVPGGRKPRIVRHQEITVVVCSQSQIDATYIDQDRVYVGVNGLDRQGNPIPRQGFPEAMIITAGGATETVKLATPERAPQATRLNTWMGAPAKPQATGTSPRYATLSGPETLDECGTPAGYGWYRVQVNMKSQKKRLCALPKAGNRMHLFVNGERQALVGAGAEADGHLFELRLNKGENTLVGLVDHTGRFAGGNDFGRRKGWYGHLYEVKPLRAGKPKIIERDPVDPFTVRQFIIGQSKGRMLSERQALWTFTHRKKSPLLIHISGVAAPGALLLNDVPLGWYSGDQGELAMRILIEDPFAMEAFKRGANELRYAPDPDYPDAAQAMIDGLSIYECVESITEGGTWGFARWEAPGPSGYEQLSRAEVKAAKGLPCWWRTTFAPRDTSVPMWFYTNGLSKGHLFLNGRPVGRYFTATSDGKKVGPQTRLYLPSPWLKADDENEVVLFDEHGCDPSKTRIEYANRGELEPE